MSYIVRKIELSIKSALAWGKGVLVIGQRQVGKTTTVLKFNFDLRISLARPAIC